MFAGSLFPESGGGGAVDSVNGQTGVVVLDAADVGAVESVNGHTGIVTLTAADVGAVQSVNGHTGIVALTAADVSALPSSTTIPSGANPSASTGLSAVNGSAGTFMRSDGAPALSQAIAPTWTNQHIFSATIGWSVSSAAPRATFNETDQASDEKLWDLALDAKILTLRTRTDADGAGVNILAATRGTGTAITAINLGNATNNPTFGFLGTGAISMAGGLTVTSTGGINAVRFSATGSTTPNNGFYLPATNTLGWATNSTQRLTINASGQVALQTVGAGLSIKEGSNAKMGTATLVAGAATVSTTAVTATSRIFVLSQVDGGTPGYLRVSTRTAGTSFVITSGSALDTSTVAWMIVEPS